MTDASNSISAEGRAKAEAELEHLREVRRPEIVRAIKTAREFGDLKENAEYHAAREAQGMNEARIRSLEHHLAHAEVRESAPGDGAGAGSRVSYRDASSGKLSEATLVHPLESSVAEAKISVDSPIGQALVGVRKGDRVQIETPGGSKQLEILDVS